MAFSCRYVTLISFQIACCRVIIFYFYQYLHIQLMLRLMILFCAAVEFHDMPSNFLKYCGVMLLKHVVDSSSTCFTLKSVTVLSCAVLTTDTNCLLES